MFPQAPGGGIRRLGLRHHEVPGRPSPASNLPKVKPSADWYNILKKNIKFLDGL